MNKKIYLICKENLKKHIEASIEDTEIIGYNNYFDIDDISKKGEEIDIVYLENSIEYDDVLLSGEMQKHDFGFKKIPSVNEMLGSVTYSQLDNLTYENVFSKKEKNILEDYSDQNVLQDKVVLVAGAAGSIGSEIVRQLTKMSPKKIILVDINENNLYFLELFLKSHFFTDIEVVIANIQNKNRMREIFEMFNPDIMFSAAASKHVPLCELNPGEAIKNNVIGTYNLFKLANDFELERAVLISTDKAVNPTNVMGATKRLAEMIVSNIDYKMTKVSIVRFGNVWGSEGSLLHIIKNRIKQKKSLTLTHKEVTRYFMSIEEAAQLVIVSGILGDKTKLFVLEMGEPVKIYDVLEKIKKMINLENDIEIIGLRPGEKLYEELSYNIDRAEKTPNNKIMILKDELNIRFNVDELMDKYYRILKEESRKACIDALKEDVTTFKPKG